MSASDFPSWKARYMRACRTMNAQERIIGRLRGDLSKAVNKIAELESMLADLRTIFVYLNEIVTTPWFQNARAKEFAMELIRNLGIAPNHRRYSLESHAISYFLYCCSGKRYRFLKQFLPFPSVSLLYECFHPLVLAEEQYLTEICSMVHIMEQWRFQNGLAADLRVPIILGVDAATFEADDNTPIVELTICKKGHLFFALPLDLGLSNFSAHLKFLPSWSLGNHPAEKCSEIPTELRKGNFDVLAMATDGDRSCLKRHDLLYDRYSARISAPMDELIHVIDDTEIWEISDPLHVFKCQRCRLVHRLSFTRVDKPFTARSLISILGLGPPLERFTGIYHMNDVLVTTLFIIENCLKLLFAGALSGLYYLLPFSI
jgi:hypothetical protein